MFGFGNQKYDEPSLPEVTPMKEYRNEIGVAKSAINESLRELFIKKVAIAHFQPETLPLEQMKVDELVSEINALIDERFPDYVDRSGVVVPE